MALTSAELQRIRAELGYNVLSAGAEPFIGVAATFETVIANNMTAGAATTSATTVPVSDTPTLVTLTLASATGFAAGDRVWVGVGDSLESSTVQSLSGLTISLRLTKAQSGTYPVYVDGGEAIVREYLDRIARTKREMSTTFGEGALKKADELEWYQVNSKTGSTLFDNTMSTLMSWRDELASVLGVPNMWRRKQQAASAVSVY